MESITVRLSRGSTSWMMQRQSWRSSFALSSYVNGLRDSPHFAIWGGRISYRYTWLVRSHVTIPGNHKNGWDAIVGHCCDGKGRVRHLQYACIVLANKRMQDGELASTLLRHAGIATGGGRLRTSGAASDSGIWSEPGGTGRRVFRGEWGRNWIGKSRDMRGSVR